MKTFKQFNEGLVGAGLKALGKTKLIDIAKIGIGGYAAKKGLDFLGSRNKDSKKEEPKKKTKYKKYENPGDGSIPGRYKDESLRDYKKRRYDEYQKQIDAS